MNTIPVIGILGGGQLGRMFIQEALSYNAEIHVLDPDQNAPCASIANRFVCGDFKDYQTVIDFARDVDVLTIEIEHVNSAALKDLEEQGKQVYPQSGIIALIQDKGVQKQFYAAHQIPTSPFIVVADHQQLGEVDEHWFPCFQKLCTSGYDGKGVKRLDSKADLSEAFQAPSVLEKKVDVALEFAIIVSGHADGKFVCFPPVDMVFHPTANLVEFLSSPSSLSNQVLHEAEQIALKIAQLLNIRGLLAIEFFLDQDGHVLVNEMAPRTHNSGHHSIEGNETSQFEQHFRAIAGLPAGDTKVTQPSVMLNLLGEPGYDGVAKYEGLNEVLRIPGVHLHLYGKKFTKPYRKMGHITVTAQSVARALELAQEVKSLIKVKA